jgi:hypothetical protein
VSAVTDIVSICGAEKLAKLWFVRDPKWVKGVTKTLADTKRLNAFGEAVKKEVT